MLGVAPRPKNYGVADRITNEEGRLIALVTQTQMVLEATDNGVDTLDSDLIDYSLGEIRTIFVSSMRTPCIVLMITRFRVSKD